MAGVACEGWQKLSAPLNPIDWMAQVPKGQTLIQLLKMPKLCFSANAIKPKKLATHPPTSMLLTLRSTNPHVTITFVLQFQEVPVRGPGRH